MRYNYILCVSVAACLSCPVVWSAAASADLGDQLFKLLPNDGAGGDRFGGSVAISGTTAIVGATYHTDNGTQSGSAYLFDATTGVQIAKLLPDDGTSYEWFGSSVGISGATAIVGAMSDDDICFDSGSAYLFDTTTGRQIAKLVANDAAARDHFGISVAISGATAIVGARWDDDNGPASGSAYLFDATTGAQIAKLLPDDGTGYEWFGYSVAISGAIVIVGAHHDGDNGLDSGSAYLFDISDPVNPTQLLKLLPDDGAAGDYFGKSVAISGATAIVGAVGDDDNGGSSGAAYLFDTTTSRQIAKLLPDDGAANDIFGWSVAISATTAIVGAPKDDDNGTWSGSAYLFDISDPANATQIAKLQADDSAQSDFFGGSVAISGATAIAGSPGDDDNGTGSGSAYLFDAAGGPGKCPWDLDDNGSVGASDLLSLLVSWGRCKGCPADFDGNGSVGAADLLALLVNWGPCP